MARGDRPGSTLPATWDPFRELEEVTNRLRDVMNTAFGPLSTWPTIGTPVWSPLFDIEETDDAYVVEADLPGVRREDIAIELVGNELVISGEVKEKERRGILRRRTRRTGRFEVRVLLPEHVDADKIEAKLADGVLTVRVPKTAQAQRRRIEVRAA
jgi:HSP20 family protein